MDGGMAYRFGRRACPQTAVTFSRKESDRMAVGFPLLAQEQQGALGQRDVAILIAFASPDVEEHALGIDVADLEIQTFP